MGEIVSEQLITLDNSKRPEIKQHFGKSLEIARESKQQTATSNQ